jgi:hypothetical protein
LSLSVNIRPPTPTVINLLISSPSVLIVLVIVCAQNQKLLHPAVNMTPKPAIVFVPGAWHTPECFEAAASFLTEAGYDYEGVNKPSSTLKPPFPKSLNEDVEVIRAAILQSS